VSLTQENSHTPLSALSLARDFAELGRTLARQPDEDATWHAVVEAAREAIPGVEDADITIVLGNSFRSLAPTSELPNQVDKIQYELRSGPCVDAVLKDTVFRTGELAHDQRWPEFGARAAAEYGVRSMLAFRLFLEDDDVLGGLNLFSTQPDAFDERSELVGSVVAAHAAIALATSRSRAKAENLERAQQSNREIGMALGILMSRHRVTRQEAFDLLRVASQHSHRKLHDIALDVVDTGMLDFPSNVS
jgi:GAF domain-containing protein